MEGVIDKEDEDIDGTDNEVIEERVEK